MTWHEMVGESVFSLHGANRGAMVAVWWNVALLVLSVGALPFDRRTILGLNPWIKPIKFEVSVIVFLLTMAVLLAGLGRLGALPRWRAAMSWGFGVAMIVENTIIALQSLRGVRSHMNYTSAFNGAAFGVMGIFIVVNTVFVALLLVSYFTTRTGLPGALMLGVQLGLLMLLAGSVEGTLMVGKYQGHTVGAADGGAGLPFVNWSTGHGDLRVAHFFALHALQTLIFTGWLMSRTTLPAWAQRSAVGVFAVVYAAGVWALFAQATAGRPVWGGG